MDSIRPQRRPLTNFRNIKAIGGLVLIICGLLVAIYVGGWLCLVGGIAGLIAAIRAPTVDEFVVAFNIGRILFSGVVGFLFGILFIFPGCYLLGQED